MQASRGASFFSNGSLTRVSPQQKSFDSIQEDLRIILKQAALNQSKSIEELITVIIQTADKLSATINNGVVLRGKYQDPNDALNFFFVLLSQRHTAQIPYFYRAMEKLEIIPSILRPGTNWKFSELAEYGKVSELSDPSHSQNSRSPKNAHYPPKQPESPVEILEDQVRSLKLQVEGFTRATLKASLYLDNEEKLKKELQEAKVEIARLIDFEIENVRLKAEIQRLKSLPQNHTSSAVRPPPPDNLA